MPIMQAKSLLLAAVLAAAGSVHAASPAPAPTNVDPLTLYARTTWPEDVHTVADAASYILEPSGYSIVIGATVPPGHMAILDAPVPPIARVNRTMPVIDILQLLIGQDAWIIVDPQHRLLSFSKEAP